MQCITLNNPGGGSRSFYHRGTKSDHGVIRQMFKDQDYALRRLRRGDEIKAMAQHLARPLIIDAGANIGASVVYFSFYYPHARIVAFEPDAANFALLERNTTGLNVELHKAAIGSRDGTVRLVDPGMGEWGFRTEAAEDGDTELVSISRVVAESRDGGWEPFIAKIDIEGNELDLFSPPTEWIDTFPLVIVELHDWLLPRQGTSRTFLQCAAARDRDFVHIGENIFSIRNGA